MSSRLLLWPLAGVGVLLGGCQWIPGTKANKIADAQEVASQLLIDPTSAIFRNVAAFEVVDANGNPATAVCGEINGKNRNGAYAGYTRFIASPELVEAVIEQEPMYSGEEVTRMVQQCTRDAERPYYSAAARDLVLMQCQQSKDAAEEQLALAGFELDWAASCVEEGGGNYLPQLVTTPSEAAEPEGSRPAE
ncbi:MULTISPECIES: hypothetical protein [unclassified Erythrobacter]|jgi:hypothetical protein|uniref:hypothetical protein n=1 Tax=unclassified Erythrobacter TaxID=2633097 RepID=UPI0007B9C70F|nr:MULTISPECIES: hypothetical protein [unclassified Erythrobacter]KZY92279.1 hypothetical protein A3745_03475 [Erythrobacter sp. HI0074]KZZ08667.1 hypothetical protein A3748_10875 [Erythrobacter sp. HI0077]